MGQYFNIPPAYTLKEELKEREWSVDTLANLMSVKKATFDLFLKGEHPLTEQIAFELEKVLGITAEFWLNLENNYRKALELEEKQVNNNEEYGLDYCVVFNKDVYSKEMDRSQELLTNFDLMGHIFLVNNEAAMFCQTGFGKFKLMGLQDGNRFDETNLLNLNQYEICDMIENEYDEYEDGLKVKYIGLCDIELTPIK